jgi:hypothetical protein
VTHPLPQPAPPAKRSVLLPILTFCAAALPLLYLIHLVHRYAVPIPMLDDWEMAPLIVKAHTGGLSFSDIFAQQQESRTIFPKLIFILFAMGRYWDPRIEMFLSILICCLTSWGIYLLLRKSNLPALPRAVAFLLMVLLIFSPAQQELWVFASGFPSFIPVLCVVWGLVVIRSNFSVRTKFLVCLMLTFFSSFTLANGLLAWPLTFPILLLIQPGPGRIKWTIGWLGAWAACMAVYFWTYIKPHDLPPFGPLESPLAYGQYLLAFLGSGLARVGVGDPLAASTAVGAFLFLGYLAALGHALVRFRDLEYRARVFPWLALGLYSIGSGCLAALGRIQWGVSQALESRYVTFSLYLTVALIALVPIVLGEVRKSRKRSGVGTVLAVTMGLFAAAYLTLELLCAAASVPLLRARSAHIRQGQAAVLFSQVLDTSELIRRMNFPRAHFVQQNADALDRLHLLRTPLIRNKEISQLRHSEADGAVASGWVDGLVPAEENKHTAWGWAAFVGKKKPADGVVLAYGDQRGEWIAFALSNGPEVRPDVVRTLGKPEQIWSGWRATFPRDAVPPGAKISIWALDAKEGKLYRLGAQTPELKL